MIGKIERIHLRKVWKHEALDFTQWLKDNIDVLSDALPISLSNPEAEQKIGSFNVDIVAEDDSGNPVVIENQLERSNHDHLGKLLTYLTTIGAKTGIWLVSDPRPEHITAVTWLNESSGANFYLLKLEAVKIGESPPAALLTRIVGPSEDSKQVGETKKEIAERYKIRQQFWTKLLELANSRTKLHSNISPGQYSWIGTSSGVSGINYNYTTTKHETAIEVYIDRGKDSEVVNLNIFDKLLKHKDEIEASFGEVLDWERLESKRACRIAKRFKSGGYRDEDLWPHIHEEMVSAMDNFQKAIQPYIAKIRVRK